jgi:hypothetical protein
MMLLLPVGFCATLPSDAALCGGLRAPLRDLAALEAQMPDAVAVAAANVILPFNAGCGA